MDGVLSPLLRKWRFFVIKKYITKNVLDYGCGIGLLPRYITDLSSYIGVDISLKDLEVAQKNNPSHLFITPEKLNKDLRFDSIVSLAVIEYINDLQDFFRNLEKKLTPTGCIVITSPHPTSQLVRNILIKLKLLGREGDQNRLWLPTKGDLQTIAYQADLELLEYKRFMFGLNQVWVFGKKQKSHDNIL